jgi:N-acetylmuramoyl-L-alanine amidase
MNKWNKKFWRCCGWLFMTPMLAFASGNAQLTAIRFTTVNDAPRIIFSLNQSTVSHVFTLSNPERLVVDFERTRLNAATKNTSFAAAGIKSVRSGHPSSTTLRMVIDLSRPIYFKVSSQPRDREVVIDIGSPSQKIQKKPVITFKRQPVEHAPVIVIDAGHGGKDAGAVGFLGTKEKDVTLRVAKILAEFINQHSRMRAVLTRDGDYYVPLRGRLKLARKGKADLFIALHADSYFNNQAFGASIYTLSQHGATTEAARWLAQRENNSELGGVDLSELVDQSYLLRSVLIDLAQTATITDSQHLGGMMLSSLSNLTRLHYRHVEQAPFMVLKSPDIPSILVEMGFISNEKEERRLRDRDYQNRMARALFVGIQNYLQKYPITGG